MVKNSIIAVLSIVTFFKAVTPGDMTVEISYTYIRADINTFVFIPCKKSRISSQKDGICIQHHYIKHENLIFSIVNKLF